LKLKLNLKTLKGLKLLFRGLKIVSSRDYFGTGVLTAARMEIKKDSFGNGNAAQLRKGLKIVTNETIVRRQTLH
jgi:hypothetical protein